MTYEELIRLYFERSTALQWYWTLYVLVIGGLLAISSMRHRGDLLMTTLVTVLYCCFAYKNLGAIHDVTMQRSAILESIHAYHPASPNEAGEIQLLRERIEPTLVAPEYGGVRNFHVMSDLLTIAVVWAMERRRRKAGRDALPIANA